MRDVGRKRIPLLWSTVSESALAEGFSFNMGVQSIRVSAEERSCLEGGVNSEKGTERGRR